jgi:hypothetical protein
MDFTTFFINTAVIFGGVLFGHWCGRRQGLEEGFRRGLASRALGPVAGHFTPHHRPNPSPAVQGPPLPR